MASLFGLLVTVVIALLAAVGGGARAEPRQQAGPAPRPAAQVHLYVSPTTTAYFTAAGGRYEVLVQPWRSVIAAVAPELREIDRIERLERLSGHGGDVLVLPSAVALSEVERAQLLRFRREGGSVLATWATGARDGQGRWLGHGFLRELTGIAVKGELDRNGPLRFLIPYGETPVNRSVPAGRRLWLGQLAERPLLLAGGTEAAAYMDWSRTVLRRGDHHSAIVHDETGGSRVVLFGYAETAWDFQPAEMRALAEDAVRWLCRQPAAQLAAWPGGYRAAQLIEMDTEEGFGNAIHFAELMESMNAAGTFYSLTSEARQHRPLVRRLAEKHEIGFHGEVHLGFKGLPRAKQQVRLERMMRDMREVLGDDTAGGRRWPRGAGHGFRAPTEAYDDHTEAVLQAMGFRHHVVDPNRSNDRLPMFAGAGGHGREGGAAADPSSALVLLPRGQLDDLNYMQLKLDDDQIGAALIGEYELNLRMAGLAVLSVHSQNFADPDLLLRKPQQTALMTHALEDLARHVGQVHDRVWMAPGGRIAQWWRDRSRASLAARHEGTRLVVELQIAGPATIEGLTIRIDHPRENAVPLVQALRPATGPATDPTAPPLPPLPPAPAAAARQAVAVAMSTSPAAGLPATVLPQVRSIDRFSSVLVFPAAAPGRHRYVVTFP